MIDREKVMEAERWIRRYNEIESAKTLHELAEKWLAGKIVEPMSGSEIENEINKCFGIYCMMANLPKHDFETARKLLINKLVGSVGKNASKEGE